MPPPRAAEAACNAATHPATRRSIHQRRRTRLQPRVLRAAPQVSMQQIAALDCSSDATSSLVRTAPLRRAERQKPAATAPRSTTEYRRAALRGRWLK